MLLKRVVTAIALLLLLALSVTVAAPWGFPAVALCFVAIGVLEWMRLLGVPRAGALLLALAEGLAMIYLAYLDRSGAMQLIDLLLQTSAVLWCALLALLLVRRRFFNVKPWRVAYAAAGMLFLAAAGLALLMAYNKGLVFLVSVLALVWIADICAYFCGRAFGKHKLAPAISPGKTVEGAIGGVVAVVLLALGSTRIAALSDSFFAVLSAHLPLVAVVLVLVFLVMLSICGDLFESHLKRQAGVKDSGTVLPGHGGILDRIDALLPVLPIAVLFGRYL
jgi:phosphatidate cytidylyltransferase